MQTRKIWNLTRKIPEPRLLCVVIEFYHYLQIDGKQKFNFLPVRWSWDVNFWEQKQCLIGSELSKLNFTLNLILKIWVEQTIWHLSDFKPLFTKFEWKVILSTSFDSFFIVQELS